MGNHRKRASFDNANPISIFSQFTTRRALSTDSSSAAAIAGTLSASPRACRNTSGPLPPSSAQLVSTPKVKDRLLFDVFCNV